MNQPSCTVMGCEKDSKTAGLCNSHYKRNRRHGDPLGGAQPRDRRPLEERFRSGYSEVESGCWEWHGALDSHGYGVMRHRGRIAAHRYSFESATGRKSFGEIDHTCRNRKCVNPDHLREVDKSQNQQNLATLRDTRSGYRGVAWHEHSRSWHVVVGHLGHQHSGGYFKDVHEAGRAAIALRNRLYTHNEEDRKLAA